MELSKSTFKDLELGSVKEALEQLFMLETNLANEEFEDVGTSSGEKVLILVCSSVDEGKQI